MLQLHQNSQRGTADHGWLRSKHSFSFGHYYNPEQMGFGPLLVINEDIVQPAQGFGTHPHQDMEIISYVLSGALEHKDSMGNGSVIRQGDVQRMSAGSGVSHSEFNHSKTEPVHFLQIWIAPNVKGLKPSYEEQHFATASKTGNLRLIASADGRDGSVLIHQNANVYAAILDESATVECTLDPKRSAYVHVIRGQIDVNQIKLETGDALKIQAETSLKFTQANNAELLLFDLPF